MFGRRANSPNSTNVFLYDSYKFHYLTRRRCSMYLLLPRLIQLWKTMNVHTLMNKNGKTYSYIVLQLEKQFYFYTLINTHRNILSIFHLFVAFFFRFLIDRLMQNLQKKPEIVYLVMVNIIARLFS